MPPVPPNPVLGPGGPVAGGINTFIQVNTGDIMAINARLRGATTKITAGLHRRANKVMNEAIKRLDAKSPVGEGVDWRRGSPPIRGAHRGRVRNAYYAEVWTTAPHEKWIVVGFEPHRPPPQAWIGEPRDAWPRLQAVMDAGTPENPRDYWEEVHQEISVINFLAAQEIASGVFGPGMNLMDVREAIVEILTAEMPGWQGYPYLVDQFQAPAFFVGDPLEWNYAQTLGRGISLVLPVRFAVPRADEQGAHEIISALLSTEEDSPFDIFFNHANLNGTVDSSYVARAGRMARYRTGGGDSYLGVELELEIEA